MNLISPINDLGYGIVGRNIAREIYKLNPDSKLYVLGNPDPNPTAAESRMFEQGRIVDRSLPDFRLWHQYDMGFFVSNKRKMGLTFFELDRLTRQEVSHLSSLDVLFVPSKWAKNVCIENGVVRPEIVVLPMAVDTDTFPCINSPYQQFLGYNPAGFMEFGEPSTENPTVFMTCGKWEIRKGHDLIIEAFETAFTPKNNVRLIVNCHNPFISNNEEWETRYLRRNQESDQIQLISGRLRTQHDLARLYSMVDCGLFPSRAEGFNMEAAELLAMGKDCIMTNYSGHTEFAEECNAFLIPEGKPDIADDGVFFNSNDPKWEGNPGKWTSIDFDCLVSLMKEVHENKKKYKMTNNPDGVAFFKNWTWEKVAKTIYEKAHS